MTVTYKGLKFGVNTGRYSENWSQYKSYPALSMVKKNGNTYVSKKVVPASGILLENKEYWCTTAPYNPQIESYIKEANRITDSYGKLSAELFNSYCEARDLKASVSVLEKRVAELEKKVG